MKKKLKKFNQGFTLIELVVVVAILGVLTTIAIPKVGQSKIKSEIAVHNANVRVLKSAGLMYLSDNPQDESLKEEKDITTNVKSYLEGEKLPKPIKSVSESFKIIIKNGQVSISPGEVKLDENGKATEIIDNKS